MYEYWRDHRTLRNGLSPTPTELSKACGTSYQAAKEAVCRYRRGRVPAEYLTGLSPKSVRNIHRLLHRALTTPSRGTTWSSIRPNTRACPGAPPWPERSFTLVS